MIASDQYEREDSEFGNSVKMSDSPSYDSLINHNSNSHSNSAKKEIRRNAGNCQNTTEVDSGSELNRLSGELNQRITQEMNGFMNSFSLQILRGINEAINEQVLPQLRASLRSVNGQ